jgi:predicted PurR-regulated permease PerM
MIVIAVAALYFGRDIFVPLALAMLLSFALAPLVRRLRRLRVPNLPAVLAVVVLAFLIIFALGAIVAWQAADLAGKLPTYRSNIEAKVVAFSESPPGGRLFERAADMVRDLGRRIEQEEAKDSDALGDVLRGEEREPLPVEIQDPAPTSLQIITTILGPLMSPLATAGIVIVFVIFLLLRREDIRDRLIRLAGVRGLPRTTQALDDAAQRVGRYLLMQLVVNTTYAIPIGIGLWLIGIPNPVLWALLCGLMRFVPYIGPIVAAFFPLALSIAVDPGWTTLLLTGALFIVIELLSNNFVEPWLYGASTGLSPLAVIAAAVFWTWLWGPIGLLLSTPLTVCLVVLGRHVPQFAFLDVLLGAEPALDPPELLYRRFLAHDPIEATERAEEYLRESTLETYYDDVLVPALALAENDRQENHLSEEQQLRVAESAFVLIDNLDEWEANGRGKPEPAEDAADALTGREVVCAGARGTLDDAVAAALAQVLERRGARVRAVSHESLKPAALKALDIERPAAIVLSYLNSDSLAHARFLARRLRRRLPTTRIVVGLWTFGEEEAERRDPLEATGADAVATSFMAAVESVVGLLAKSPADDTASELATARL